MIHDPTMQSQKILNMVVKVVKVVKRPNCNMFRLSNDREPVVKKRFQIFFL